MRQEEDGGSIAEILEVWDLVGGKKAGIIR